MKKVLEADGWYVSRINGSHHQFKHPTKKGTVTIAIHGNAELPRGTKSGILKQAGLK